MLTLYWSPQVCTPDASLPSARWHQYIWTISASAGSAALTWTFLNTPQQCPSSVLVALSAPLTAWCPGVYDPADTACQSCLAYPGQPVTWTASFYWHLIWDGGIELLFYALTQFRVSILHLKSFVFCMLLPLYFITTVLSGYRLQITGYR